MRRTALLVLVCALGLSRPVPAGDDLIQERPTFRTGVELVQLDVSVLDRDRKPVLGLTAGDFSVEIDGAPARVATLEAIDLSPASGSPSAVQPRRAATVDIATNTRPSGRVVVILVDDYSFSEAAIELPGVQRARQTALNAIEALGPNDVAAVAFTGYAHTAQAFTSDRERLRAAIEKAPLFGSDLTPDDSNNRGFCRCGVCSIEAIGRVAQQLRSLSEHRKLLLYISAGSFIEIPTWTGMKVDPCLQPKRDAVHAAVREAQLANLMIQAIDPKGLRSQAGTNAGRGGVLNIPEPADPLRETAAMRVEFLRMMAETTGGRAVVNNNDMQEEVQALLAEGSAYYLLGIERPPAANDGRLRRVAVRVNRPELTVRTRSGYFDTTGPGEASTQLAGGSTNPRALDGVLPIADIPLELAAAPFAAPDRSSALAVALRVRPPATGPLADAVEIHAALYGVEQGNEVAARSHRLELKWAPDVVSREYEVLSRLQAPPGRYELRVALQAADGRSASVYQSIEIPEFDSENVAVSGLMVAVNPAGLSQPQDELRELLPIVPTARRSFNRTDRVSAFLRIYQRIPGPGTPQVTARLLDATGVVLGQEVQQLEWTSLAGGASADFRSELPLEGLPAGEYDLVVQTSVNQHSTERSLRFKVE